MLWTLYCHYPLFLIIILRYTAHKHTQTHRNTNEHKLFAGKATAFSAVLAGSSRKNDQPNTNLYSFSPSLLLSPQQNTTTCVTDSTSTNYISTLYLLSCGFRSFDLHPTGFSWISPATDCLCLCLCGHSIRRIGDHRWQTRQSTDKTYTEHQHRESSTMQYNAQLFVCS